MSIYDNMCSTCTYIIRNIKTNIDISWITGVTILLVILFGTMLSAERNDDLIKKEFREHKRTMPRVEQNKRLKWNFTNLDPIIGIQFVS